MKNRDFVILCLRLLSIYLGVVGLSSLPNVTSIFVQTDHLPISIVLTPFLFLTCALVLFCFAPRMSSFIVQFSEAEDEGVQISPSEKTARIALLVLGIFIFVDALPQLIQLSIDVGLYYKDIDKIPKDVKTVQNRWTYLIGPIIKLIISAVLIIGPDKVIGFLSKYDTTFKRLESSEKRIES